MSRAFQQVIRSCELAEVDRRAIGGTTVDDKTSVLDADPATERPSNPDSAFGTGNRAAGGRQPGGSPSGRSVTV